jgi:nicotinate-nucleotide adenylyltransferase
MKKIGIMGGTFNPIHNGHLFLAENAFDQIGLDQILFMPSKNPPHKAKPEKITDQQRVDMINLAICDNSHFALSTVELERDGYTYTADTLTLLAKENQEVRYYFIVGADSLFMMHQWYQPQVIFDLCTVVAAGRDHVDGAELAAQAELLEEQYHADIQLISMPTIQIASADIRDRVAQNKTIRYYLPDQVARYICQHGLYHINPTCCNSIANLSDSTNSWQ